jgi:hypothetical protein
VSSKFKQLAAKEREVQPRVAIPQIDPADTSVPAEATPAPSPVPSALESESVSAPEPQEVTESAPSAPIERPIYLTPVDTSETPFNRGFHMYPSRHRQLLDLAYIEDRKPWEIVEQALAEYVKRHYRGRAGDR